MEDYDYEICCNHYDGKLCMNMQIASEDIAKKYGADCANSVLNICKQLNGKCCAEHTPEITHTIVLCTHCKLRLYCKECYAEDHLNPNSEYRKIFTRARIYPTCGNQTPSCRECLDNDYHSNDLCGAELPRRK